MSDRLFSGRFVVMCGFTFTVFISMFQLLPTAPYRVLALGGSTATAGLFLGCLTYASALSAPLTGSLVDRIGQRRVLIAVSLILTCFTASYAFVTDVRVMFLVVFAHGVFWSGLLSASGAYMTSILPAARRAEGLGYWGLMSASAVGIAPALGFWVYQRGWTTVCVEMVVLNLAMAAIAWRLPETSTAGPRSTGSRDDAGRQRSRIDWRVLRLSATLSLISFGYGGLTSFSALFLDALHVAPRSLYLSVMAATLVASRLIVGRRLDVAGHRVVLVPCLLTPAAGLGVLALVDGRLGVALSSIVFGVGFGLMYPAFTAFVMHHVDERRRGAAYGAIIAAFDSGIGLGSTALGWVIGMAGYRVAFGVAAAIAALALPYFLLAERGFQSAAAPSAPIPSSRRRG